MWFLAQIYIPLCSATILGVGISAALGLPPIQRQFSIDLQKQTPASLGHFLYLYGVPLSTIHFIRQADLSQGVLLAPAIAWVVFFMALGLALLWVRFRYGSWSASTKGTFLLASMFGNTGYIGYPVVLLLPPLGTDYFGWALFYDMLGTLFGAYGLGVAIAAYYGAGINQGRVPRLWLSSLLEIFKTPTIWSFFLGLALRAVAFPIWLGESLRIAAWMIVMLSLVLMGMRLQQIKSRRMFFPALQATAIRMVLTPLVIGYILTLFGVVGPARLVMVLQAGMPSAFATLVLAETFDLNRDLAVTCVGTSSVALLLTLPIWLGCFPA